MAGQIKKTKGEYEDIIRKLFAGQEGALIKLAKMRRVQYELGLWQRYDLPLSEVPAKYKRYFSEKFLKKARIDEVSYRTLSEAFQKLNVAVGIDVPGKPTGCYARCLSLVGELNEALTRNKLRPIENPRKFIDRMTFDIEVVTGVDGRPAVDKPYHSPICHFHDEENRQVFWKLLQIIMRFKLRISMYGVFEIMRIIRREAVKVPPKDGEP